MASTFPRFGIGMSSIATAQFEDPFYNYLTLQFSFKMLIDNEMTARIIEGECGFFLRCFFILPGLKINFCFEGEQLSSYVYPRIYNIPMWLSKNREF